MAKLVQEEVAKESKVVKVLVKSRSWRSLSPLNETFQRAQMLLRQAMTADQPLTMFNEVPVFKNVGKRSTAKTTALLVFFLWLVKSLKNLLIIGLLIT